MISPTTSKFVCSGGITRKSYGVAAAAIASVTKANGNGVSASEAPNDPKVTRKKLPIAQRRAMVEAFVHNYKAMNDGKLPSVSKVVKQVGGSYYVVRKILQELESQLKTYSANKANQKAVGKKIIKEDVRFFEAVATNKTSVIADIQDDFQMLVTNPVETCDASRKHTEAETDSQSSSSSDKTFSKEDENSELAAAQTSHLKGDAEIIFHSSLQKLDMEKSEAKTSDFVRMPSNLAQEEFENVSHPCHVNSENGKMREDLAQGDIPVFVALEIGLQMMNSNKVSHPGLGNLEDNKFKKEVSEGLRDKDVLKDQAEQHEGTPVRKPAVDKSLTQTSEAEVPKKSTLWENLKSFADGIINIWR